MFNPIFPKKVQGQKHPGKCGIVEHQIPSIKVLFKTNTNGHKHPSIRLLSKSKTQLLSNYIHYKVWEELTYPFPNANVQHTLEHQMSKGICEIKCLIWSAFSSMNKQPLELGYLPVQARPNYYPECGWVHGGLCRPQPQIACYGNI